MENNIKLKQKISTANAIIVAGVLIMVAILLTNHKANTAPKTLSEQVGVSKTDLTACINRTDVTTLKNNIITSVTEATKGLPETRLGTPYTIIIGKNDVKTDITGAESYDNMKKIVDDALVGKVTTKYAGNVPPITASDHVLGNADAPVTIIEYSDFECPFCKQFQPVLQKIMVDESPNVKWVYRHWPLHQHSVEKLVAAECVAKLKGNVAFWKYGDLLFGLLDPQPDSVSEQL